MWISFGKNIYLIATSPTLWYSSALPKNGRWTQYSTSWPFWQDCYGTFSNKQMVASHPWKQTADQRNEGFLSHGDTPSYIYIYYYILYYYYYYIIHFFGWIFHERNYPAIGNPPWLWKLPDIPHRQLHKGSRVAALQQFLHFLQDEGTDPLVDDMRTNLWHW